MLFLLPLIVVLLLGAYIYFIAPSVSRRGECLEFAKWDYAHRGLWSRGDGIPENSLPAFSAAVRERYAIELDVQVTRDGALVVFHDDTLERMCGRKERVRELSLKELRTLRLTGSDQRIPLFREVLETVRGRVPLLIELKMPDRDALVCSELARELQDYSGRYCVESFNSLALRWFAHHRPDVLRGQLSSRFTPRDNPHPLLRFLATQLMLNWLGRPDFIAYQYRYAASSPGFWLDRHLFRAPAFAWTVRNDRAYLHSRERFDTTIFEHIRPPVHHSEGESVHIA